MSTARDSVLYSDIQDLLEKQLPEHGYPVPPELIRDILNDLFDSVALHVWSREDVISIVNKRGWPISPEATDEVLGNIEYYIDKQIIPSAMRILGYFGIKEDQLRTGRKQKSLLEFFT